MKRFSKKLTVLLAVVMLVGCLAMFLSMAGCEEEQEILEYNATLYDQPMQWMNPEYLKKNATYDANQTENLYRGQSRISLLHKKILIKRLMNFRRV